MSNCMESFERRSKNKKNKPTIDIFNSRAIFRRCHTYMTRMSLMPASLSKDVNVFSGPFPFVLNTNCPFLAACPAARPLINNVKRDTRYFSSFSIQPVATKSDVPLCFLPADNVRLEMHSGQSGCRDTGKMSLVKIGPGKRDEKDGERWRMLFIEVSWCEGKEDKGMIGWRYREEGR